MDDEPENNPGCFGQILNRMAITCIVTGIFWVLTNLVPNGRSPDPEIILGCIMVLYGVALIWVWTGGFDRS